MADDIAGDFVADSDLASSGIQITGTRLTSNSATLSFDLSGAIVVVSALVTGIEALLSMAEPLHRLLKKSQQPVVLSTALGRVTLEPDRQLTPAEIRKVLSTLARL